MPKTDADWQALTGLVWFIAFCVLVIALVVCAIREYTHPDGVPLDTITWGAACAMLSAFVFPVVFVVWRDMHR